MLEIDTEQRCMRGCKPCYSMVEKAVLGQKVLSSRPQCWKPCIALLRALRVLSRNTPNTNQLVHHVFIFRSYIIQQLEFCAAFPPFVVLHLAPNYIHFA